MSDKMSLAKIVPILNPGTSFGHMRVKSKTSVYSSKTERPTVSLTAVPFAACLYVIKALYLLF